MLTKDFFEKSATIVAEKLLGKVLQIRNEKIIITETEAYPALDSACYGKCEDGSYRITNATKPLFDVPGTVCIYGGMILISCKEKGIPENVLIRRGGYSNVYLEGPCSLGKYFNVKDNYDNLHGVNVLSRDSIIKIFEPPKKVIAKTQRVRLCEHVKEIDRRSALRFIGLSN